MSPLFQVAAGETGDDCGASGSVSDQPWCPGRLLLKPGSGVISEVGQAPSKTQPPPGLRGLGCGKSLAGCQLQAKVAQGGRVVAAGGGWAREGPPRADQAVQEAAWCHGSCPLSVTVLPKRWKHVSQENTPSTHLPASVVAPSRSHLAAGRPPPSPGLGGGGGAGSSPWSRLRDHVGSRTRERF